MESKGFKRLLGMRVLLSLPKRDTMGIKLTPELEQALNEEYASKLDKLEVYAIGDAVTNIAEGELIYVPTEDLKRGTFITVNGDQKLMINCLSAGIVW